jgi:hypothetical protein
VKQFSIVLALACLLAILEPKPANAVCKDCIFDACTVIGDGFGWRTCTETSRLYCIASIPIDGEHVCIVWVEVGVGCKVSNGCVGAY